MIKKVIDFHQITRTRVIFMRIMKNTRVLGVYEKTWIFHENLRNPWFRVNFADGVPGKWSKKSSIFIKSQGHV